MIIGIDARMIAHKEKITGVGRLVVHLAQFIERNGHDCVLFYNERPTFRPTSKAMQVVIPIRNRFIWEQAGLLAALFRHRVDLYHATWNYGLPLFAPGKFVVTMHDVIPLKLPNFFQGVRGQIERFIYLISLVITTLKAAWIFTDSQHSREDIIRSFPWVKGKISVIHYGREQHFRPISNSALLRKVLTKYNLPRRYVIYTGGLDVRKNLQGLIEALAMLDAGGASVHLVIVGEKNRLFPKLLQHVEKQKLSGRVHFPGYVDEKDLPVLVSGARLLAYPSFYEGFGAPVLEALACGTPIVTSNRTSIPEICGDACLLVDPEDTRAMAIAMKKLLTDQSLRQTLRQRGLQRASLFSWDKSLKAVMDQYERILS